MSDALIPVRDADLVDLDALRRWLECAAPEFVPAGTTLSARQFPAGFSNLTYLVTLHSAEDDRALVLRRPPRGVTGGIAHDMVREYGILAALHPLGVPVPRPVACCDDTRVLGAPFYLMEYVNGVILRGAPPALLTEPAEQLPRRMDAISRTFVEALVGLHRVPVDTPSLATLGKGEGYVQRQVGGWTKRWQAARTRPVPAMDAVAAWLGANAPAERGSVLVHNDFKLDNLVFDSTLSRVNAILDWEMATIGDPLMDLGTALAYWVEAGDAPIFRSLGLGITALPGAWTRADLVREYGQASGRDVSDAPFYLTFGLFKVAVIAQQIFARYEQGLTSDARFSRLGDVVEALAEKAEGEMRG
jgi:aminoglycoside phosphotransferase (APT) family kinase protein